MKNSEPVILEWFAEFFDGLAQEVESRIVNGGEISTKRVVENSLVAYDRGHIPRLRLPSIPLLSPILPFVNRDYSSFNKLP